MRDVRPHDAKGGQTRQFGGVVLAKLGREAPRGLAGAHAQDRQALDQHMIRHDPGRAARGEAHDQQPRAVRRRAQGFLQDLATHGIVDHVGAASVGHAFHDRDEIGGAIVHHQVGAVFSHDGKPRVVAAGGDDLRAEMPAELDGGQAHAARGAVHQQHFTLLEPGAMDQRMVGGLGTDAKSGPLGVGPSCRRPHQVAGGRHAHIFGEGAGPHAEDHAIARPPDLDLGADGRDGAGPFHARHEGQLRLVLVAGGEHEHVGEVDRGGADLDQQVGRTGFGDRPFLDLQDRRIAQPIANNGAH